MNKELFERNQQFLLFQRNIFCALSLILAVSLVVLLFFLFTKRERIVVVPPVVEQTFWVDGKNVSSTYLEQFGYFLSSLLLTKSPETAASQRTILLRHADAAFSGELKNKLIEEETKLKKQNASYVFHPMKIEAKPKEKKIKIYLARCTFCSQCNDICPKNCLTMSKEFLLCDVDKHSKDLIVE